MFCFFFSSQPQQLSNKVELPERPNPGQKKKSVKYCLLLTLTALDHQMSESTFLSTQVFSHLVAGLLNGCSLERCVFYKA